MIACDLEVLDPHLHELGDGAIRKDGSVLCVGLYDGRDYVCCTPDDEQLKAWLASDEDKIFHNGVYDLSWLVCGLGLKVGGIWHDTMTRTALIDEFAELNLDACCKKFGVKGKNYDDTLDAWWQHNKDRYGLKGKIWDHADIVWMTPEGQRAMVAYNRQDCIATYNLFMAQEKHIKQQDLQGAYDIECQLYPLIIDMKKTGIRIDEVARDRLTYFVEKERRAVLQTLEGVYDIKEDMISSPIKLGQILNYLGIESPLKTPKGAQSWSADALEMIEDAPAVRMVQAVKNYNALLSKYLKGGLVKGVVNGRIHSTFSANKREVGGTITGRWSSQNPNLQNISAREEKHGQKTFGREMRALFLPEEGCMLGAFDYSAIEYLLLAHYAHGQQAQWFRDQANAGIDFHTVAMQMTGITSRDIVKRMNYGFIYGMGIGKLLQINRMLFKQMAGEQDVEQYARDVYNQYHSRLPVIKDTMQWVQSVVQQAGYIKSVGGRSHHKPKAVYQDGRWNTQLYKVTNWLLQGSAADILKKGLVDARNAGVFNTLIMHLTVHDENVVSIPYNKAGTEAAIELQRCMEGAYKEQLLVPMKVVAEVGADWGAWSSEIWDEMKAGNFSRRIA